MMKLNLGSGPDYREGYTNLDFTGSIKCDYCFDLKQNNWDFTDDKYEEILALDILEHMPDTISFIDNCWDLLKIGGRLIIRTPSYDAPFAWCDPTHVKVFTKDSFDFFDPTTDYGKYNNHLTNRKWKIIKKVKTKNKNLEIELEKI